MYHVQVKVKSFDLFYISQASQVLQAVWTVLGVAGIGDMYMPRRVRKFSLLRSPHIYKKAREQFQLSRSTRVVIAPGLDTCQVALLRSVLTSVGLPGVEIEITLERVGYRA